MPLKDIIYMYIDIFIYNRIKYYEKKYKGFTLIELLVVVASFALAAVGVVVYQVIQLEQKNQLQNQINLQF